MSATQKLLRFGVFELNVNSEQLFKSAIPVKLAPQPLRLLVLLASRAGQAVTRDEIQKELWAGETFVDFEHGVNKCINQIRTVLADNADNPLYVETLPRRGYRFVAPVVSKTIPAPQPKVTESESGERSRLPVLIGGRTKAATAMAEIAAANEPSVVRGEIAAAEPKTDAAPTQKIRFRWSRARVATIGVVILLVAAAGGGLYWRVRAHKAPVLTDKDTIVLADFDNKTGDPVFDDTLKQGLAIQLEQSPFLGLIPQGKVNQTLKLMGRSPDAPLTREVAGEVCQRTGSKAMVTGSIAGLGNEYVIGLKVLNCDTGDVLVEVQEQAAGKEAVLKTLDVAALTLRGKLGESLSSVQKYATPLAEATTPSLEALQAYSLGRKTFDAKSEIAALPFFERAAELDPNFAAAYAAIAGIYKNFDQVERAAENARKAYALRTRVSDRERFTIESYYYTIATGELEKAQQVYETWQQSYPRDAIPYFDLVFIYGSLGSWDKALGEAREAMRLDSSASPVNYLDLGGAYQNLNRLDEAEAVYKEAEQRKIVENEVLLWNHYMLAFLRGDAAGMTQLVSDASGKPATEDLLLAAQADTEGWYGRLKNAHQLTRRAMDSAERSNAKETAATYQAAAALREVESGNRLQAREDADAALRLAPNRDVRAMSALALARAGETARAEKLADELDNAFLLDTIVQRYWLPTIRAAVALERKDPNRAVELLKVAGGIELGQPTQVNVYLCPVYVRGEAYLMLHDGTAAQRSFRRSSTTTDW